MARILLVEDEEAVAVTLRAVLEQDGHRVVRSWGAKDADENIRATTFELAIFDLRLQDGDGLELLKHVKQVSPATAAIVLTGYSTLESAIGAIRAGATDYLLKPCDITELRASVERALEWQRMAAQVAGLTELTARLKQVADDRDRVRRVAEARAANLERLDEVKEGFIAAATHDLRTPLASIKGYAQVLRRRLVPAEVAEDVEESLGAIEAQAGIMNRLLDNLLDASRIHVGEFKLRRSACDLRRCLDGAFELLDPLQRARVEVRMPQGSLAGRWEQSRIEQVLANLIQNALKYSPESEPVRVTVERRETEIEVAVSDRGMGIAPAELSRIFQRFHRTARAWAGGQPGTGLGLYICRGIIQAHGGRLWAESLGEGQGATFRFALPRRVRRKR